MTKLIALVLLVASCDEPGPPETNVVDDLHKLHVEMTAALDQCNASMADSNKHMAMARDALTSCLAEAEKCQSMLAQTLGVDLEKKKK